jgi:hypothetical protein
LLILSLLTLEFDLFFWQDDVDAKVGMYKTCYKTEVPALAAPDDLSRESLGPTSTQQFGVSVEHFRPGEVKRKTTPGSGLTVKQPDGNSLRCRPEESYTSLTPLAKPINPPFLQALALKKQNKLP